MRYALAAEPAAIAARLVRTVPELGHLMQARIAWLFTTDPLRLAGGEKAAIISTPTVQGSLRDLFDWFVDELTVELFEGMPPDFLVRVSVGAWESIDAIRRERLVFHELCHLQHAENKEGAPMFDDEGRPSLKLMPHDIELFHREVERYGSALEVEVVRSLLGESREV